MGGAMLEPAPSPFCHIVIPAPDLEKAKDFYQRVFGWNVQPNVPGARYWFFKSGNVGGAFNGATKPAVGSVVLVLRVEDMDAAVARIRDNGGRITQEPSAIGDADPGRDAYFLDPNGNEMGVYVGP
jgi:predicted enzyme related to lactoylglutathione lyase